MANAASSGRPSKYNVAERGSTSVQVLEAAWELLRGIEPSIPQAVLTLVDARSRRRLHGYFAWSVWKKRRGQAHEIGISPELLGHPKELLATMLHEAAHAALHESGMQGGIGKGGYYHLKSFRDQCISYGLSCEFLNTRYGFTITKWPRKAVPKKYQPVVNLLRARLPAGIGSQPPREFKGRDLPETGHTMLTCGCSDRSRTIYVKKSVLTAGGVFCSFCRQEFEVLNDSQPSNAIS